jgi:hypothetical protein
VKGPNAAQRRVREARFAGRGPQSRDEISGEGGRMQMRMTEPRARKVTRTRSAVAHDGLTFVASPARPGPTFRSRRGTAVAAEDARRGNPRSATVVSP